MTAPESGDEPHWVRWHRRYDAEDSALGRRLALVQDHVRAALDAAPAGGPIRLLSLCAGRGHDVIDVLAGHPRRAEVRARLVELEPTLADDARDAAAAAGLAQVEVVTGDAGTTDAATGAAPVHVLLLCGIFGNISDGDVERCVDLTPTLCAPGAVVIWTRHRLEPDLTPTIRAWFDRAGFEELAFGTPDRNRWAAVGAHRLVADPRPFRAGERLFTFVGDGSGAST
jgi:hypothetical protein